MENKINRITDILHRDDGISGAMMYTEQILWIFFLKFLSALEDSITDDSKGLLHPLYKFNIFYNSILEIQKNKIKMN